MRTSVMTADQTATRGNIWSTLLSLALPLVLTLIGAGLFRTALSLPFEAGGPFVDVLAPLGAIAFGVTGFVTARRGRRRHEGRRGIRALFVVETVLAGLVIFAGLLTLLLIYALCGFYWTEDSC